jgi:DNA repair protein RadC
MEHPRPFSLPDRDSAASPALRQWFAPLALAETEAAAFAYLDPQWRLSGMRHTRSLSALSVTIPIRAVIADLLALGCPAMVMAHNHPSGIGMPSEGDRILTKRLARAVDAIGVRLLDHVILTRSGITSFRALGLL